MPRPRKYPKDDECRLQIDLDTRLALAKVGRADESYNDILERLIILYEKKR